jgi:hypothetical protein
MIRSQVGTMLWKHGRRLKGSRLLADPFSRPNLIVLDTSASSTRMAPASAACCRACRRLFSVSIIALTRERGAYSPGVGMNPCPVCGRLTITAPSKRGQRANNEPRRRGRGQSWQGQITQLRAR